MLGEFRLIKVIRKVIKKAFRQIIKYTIIHHTRHKTPTLKCKFLHSPLLPIFKIEIDWRTFDTIS